MLVNRYKQVTISNYLEIQEIVKAVGNRAYENLSKEEFIKIIPYSLDKKALQEFYEKTGLTIFHYIIDKNNERNVFFNRCGAFPKYDEGNDCFIQASGEYSVNDGDIGLQFDICIEEDVQLMTQTDNLKHYVIIPENVDIPKGDPRNVGNQEFHKFYVPIESE